MRSRKKRIGMGRLAALVCVTCAAGALVPTTITSGGERQFLVILAHSPKQFGGGQPPGGLVNPELIRRQYFDKDDPNIRSFAEYWEEISYGDVRISGDTTDWIILPWRITQDPATITDDPDVPSVINLNQTISYEYGASEIFRTDRAMVIIDLDGDPMGIPNGPFTVLDNPPYAQGGHDTVPGSPVRVWMPGERFVDMDEDGAWDGLDEANNQMDFFNNVTGAPVPDNLPDLRGPWFDLNEDGVADNPNDCVYLRDSDNDRNPDCCPDGPGSPGCEPFDPTNPAAGACPAATWDGPDSTTIIDCNGNLIPDECDIDCQSLDCLQTGWLEQHPGLCGGSDDRLPLSSGDDACETESPDGIPDECQFANFSADCVATGVDDPDPCAPNPVCENFLPPRTPAPRCEYDDSNDNGVLDVVEPFENFLRRWDTNAGEWIVVTAQYVRDNYPGNDALVLAQDNVRAIRGPHDPLFKIPGRCVCRDGSPCDPITRVCDAGEHAEYHPPDSWDEIGSTKMYNIDEGDPFGGGEFLVTNTPEPVWYRQAWLDRYGTPPPPWGSATPRMIPLLPTRRRCFEANRGGLAGDGTGWIGCDNDLDPQIIFGTSDDCPDPPGIPGSIAFDQLCNARILPEEVNGIGTILVLFDGSVEHDDLPSSKYHHAGDEALGEVTSPFNEEIWGHDRGPHRPEFIGVPDLVIPAAGPYATHIHGNFGRDAGNVLHMELLTIRTDGQSLTGFTDTNLDGCVDQGETRERGSENYISDFNPFTPNNGVGSAYPWNRDRLVEDTIEILDDVRDFDDFVDPIAMDAVQCASGRLISFVPDALRPNKCQSGEDAGTRCSVNSECSNNDCSSSLVTVTPSGILSGIVLLPPGATPAGFSPRFLAIHTEDGLGDPSFTTSHLPPEAPGSPSQISWHLFVHNLVFSIGAEAESGAVPVGSFQTAFAAHEYLHAWEGFPDLYDYDVFDAGAIENCPIGRWDIMANGGLVHPVPALKEQPCTDWARPVDLTTVLTPGVDKVLTLPPAEFVRDDSYFFLENDIRPGERFYIWSAGQGFDELMPGDGGMLVLHTDLPQCRSNSDCPVGVFCRNGVCRGTGSNPDAPPAQQRSGDRPAYLIVQGDGNGELEACSAGGNRGDAGDPWPGSTGATRFNFNTNPPATWYTQNSWTGIDVVDVVPDDAGSVQLTINWVPTNIPSLRFRQPPGGVSVGSNFQVRFDATDVYGGTTIRLFYIEDEKTCSGSGAPCANHGDCPTGQQCRHETPLGPGGATFVGQLRKITPGTNGLSIDWNITGVPDGRYVFFAKLNPGTGLDGTEDKFTTPRAGRNNVGDGSLAVNAVAIDDDSRDDDDHARSETWTVLCIDPQGQEWRVNSTLTQPVLNEDDPDQDPWEPAFTGVRYTSIGGEVEFTITEGSEPFDLGDTFSFTTSGITAVSRAVTIAAGRISEDPIAIIRATPLTCPSPTEGDPCIVAFDARESVDPNGEQNLEFRWNFGDGSAEILGDQPRHTYVDAGTFTVVLRVKNLNNQRFGETAVDILVTNNSPRAVISAAPTTGQAPLEVQFSAQGSSDTETRDANQLIYHWDFGDGQTANNGRVRGISFQAVTHTYRTQEDGTPCTPDNVCLFNATLTVTDDCDGCEKDDTATIRIQVGNADPVAIVTASPLEGPEPLEVRFNAINSSDADGDDLEIEWVWDDGTPNEKHKPEGPNGDGVVTHTYTLGPNETTREFRPTAVVRDLDRDGDPKGSGTTWPGVTITVRGNEPPTAKFVVTPQTGVASTTVLTFDATGSFDPDGVIDSFNWDFGDGTSEIGAIVTHVFVQPRAAGYQVKLTVTDDRGASDDFTLRVIIEPTPVNRPPQAFITTGLRTGTAPVTLTFDGRNSFDPDGDVLVHTWEFRDDQGELIDTLNGVVVTRLFAEPGTFTVELEVSDGRGGVSRTAPLDIVVTPPGEQPPSEEPQRPQPDDGEIIDSAGQRTTPRICGFGMLTSFFASLLVLTTIRATRRR